MSNTPGHERTRPAFPVSLVSRLSATAKETLKEVLKFGVVGAVAFIVDVGVFNLLRFFGPAVLEDKPLTAKVVSVVAATTFAYFGNRIWTFQDRSRTGYLREYVLFFLLNGVALVISVACLAISHYVLGFTSPLADNISANIIGLGLGTLFRFWSYRKFVFVESRLNQVV